MTDEQAAIVVKPLDAMYVATASEPTDSFDDDFSPIFDRLYGQIFGGLARAGVAPNGPNAAFYEERSDGRVDVVAAVPIADGAGLDASLVEVRTLPVVARAATLIHRGSMATCSGSYETLLRWIDAAGERADGYSREIWKRSFRLAQCGQRGSSVSLRSSNSNPHVPQRSTSRKAARSRRCRRHSWKSHEQKIGPSSSTR